jgi:3-phenylpropionate/cinnamic acid dioxygenase small subunit
MRRNIEGLQRSTKLRAASALERAQTALRQMQEVEASINFRTVAAKAGVSTAWLYNTKSLRDRIMKLRTVSKTPVENDGRNRRLISQERVIETLRLRIKQLEAKNEELQERLEHVYGQFATTPSSGKPARRGHVHDVQTSDGRRKSLDDYR